jgi:hypothetical protein
MTKARSSTNSKTFMVYEGTYPFRDVIGTVEVQPQETPEQEASLALLEAVRTHGGHPVVEPANRTLYG